MTPALIGGILLIIGAWFTYKGNIIISISFYFIADCCWILIAYSTGDVLGAFMVSIGMILGVLAFMKMHTGKMRKSLKL